MEEEQEVKKNLWNLLKGKITFEEYIIGRIHWFMSWENVKTFILYLFMLSIGLTLYLQAEKGYENWQECKLGHQLVTKQITCYDNSQYQAKTNISQSNLTTIPSTNQNKSAYSD